MGSEWAIYNGIPSNEAVGSKNGLKIGTAKTRWKNIYEWTWVVTVKYRDSMGGSSCHYHSGTSMKNAIATITVI